MIDAKTAEAENALLKDQMRQAKSEGERLAAEAVRLREALEAVRFNLTQAGYAANSIMIEGIDAALSQKESTP